MCIYLLERCAMALIPSPRQPALCATLVSQRARGVGSRSLWERAGVRGTGKHILIGRSKVADTVKVGVIGVGQIGKRHVATYAQMPNVEIVALADVDEAEARRVAAEHGIAQTF